MERARSTIAASDPIARAEAAHDTLSCARRLWTWTVRLRFVLAEAAGGRSDCRLHEEPDEPVLSDGSARRRQRRPADAGDRGPLRSNAAGQHPGADEPDRGCDHETAER